MLPKKSLNGTSVSLADVLALKGRKVRVRGWIERNYGPYVKLAGPELIETLDESDLPGQSPPGESPALADIEPQDLPHWLRKTKVGKPRIRRRR